MNTTRMNTVRMVMLAMMVAIGVVISPILRIEGMCPTAHLINVVCSVLLGPWYSLLCSVLIGVIRMTFMGIPPLALTGAVFGAFLSGVLYRVSGGKIIITQKMIKNGCRIFVKDNGCGIPENSMKHLTDPFYRVDRSRSRQAGGTGLGLSLCREIADIHGGYIRFRSMAEKGTVVMVALKGVRNEEPS